MDSETKPSMIMKNTTAGIQCAGPRTLQPLSLIVTLLWGTVPGAGAATLVVPPGHDAVDGSAMYANEPPPPAGGRCQELYEAADFAAMIPKAGVIVKLALRPDRIVNAPRTVTLQNYQLRLSTTQRKPGGLSARFDDNLGPDATLVYSGDITWTTDGSGPANGPRAFDYVVDFQQPFVYNPKKGNLLVEWRVGNSPAGRPAFDAAMHSDGRTRLLWGNAINASAMEFSNAGRAVRQLTVESLQLAAWGQADSMSLQVTGPAAWSGRVQRSTDLETWTDWFSLIFEAAPFETNDVSAATAPQQFYRVVMP